MVVVLLSRVVRFSSDGGGGSIVIPKGFAIASVAMGCSAGAVITVVTVGRITKPNMGGVKH
jgi:hypothetical protein